MKMSKMIIVVAACVVSCAAFAQRQSNPYGNPYGGSNSNPYGSAPASGYTNPNSHAVDGYVRSNGTYVAPSHATNPNSTRSDNYGTRGNVNPYTGKAGTRY